MVREERPDLEEQKDNLVISIASGRKQLQELEDEILRCSVPFLHPQQDQTVANGCRHSEFSLAVSEGSKEIQNMVLSKQLATVKIVS